MYTDEIVEDVRRARDDFARQYDYDITRICDAIRIRQSASSRPVVSRATAKQKLGGKNRIGYKLEPVT
jgi:hypothetical protein